MGEGGREGGRDRKEERMENESGVGKNVGRKKTMAKVRVEVVGLELSRDCIM